MKNLTIETLLITILLGGWTVEKITDKAYANEIGKKWVASNKSQTKIEPINGERFHLHSRPAEENVRKSSGFGWGGTYLYANDGNLKEILKIDPTTLKIIESYNDLLLCFLIFKNLNYE